MQGSANVVGLDKYILINVHLHGFLDSHIVCTERMLLPVPKPFIYHLLTDLNIILYTSIYHTCLVRRKD